MSRLAFLLFYRDLSLLLLPTLLLILCIYLYRYLFGLIHLHFRTLHATTPNPKTRASGSLSRDWLKISPNSLAKGKL